MMDDLDIVVEGTPRSKPKSVRSDTHTLYEHDAFIMPVGNIIRTTDKTAYKGWRTEPWWCPPERIKALKLMAEEWEKNGFKLDIGDARNSSADIYDYEKGYKPQVILCEEQERGTNKPFAPSRKNIPALVGDMLVWMVVVDVEKAYLYLKEHTAVPCAIMADWIMYDEDDYYKNVIDTYNKYFIDYYETGEPYRILSKEEIEREMYGL